MPHCQCGLQHSSPGLQFLSPHDTIAFRTSQMSGHDPPGGLQIPQSGLQHSSPALHISSPHAWHACCEQWLPIGAHMLHDSLQQYSSGVQWILPHFPSWSSSSDWEHSSLDSQGKPFPPVLSSSNCASSSEVRSPSESRDSLPSSSSSSSSSSDES